MKFSDDFIFGGATAAYQCEGSTLEYGKGKYLGMIFLLNKDVLKQIQPVISIINMDKI